MVHRDEEIITAVLESRKREADRARLAELAKTNTIFNPLGTLTLTSITATSAPGGIYIGTLRGEQMNEFLEGNTVGRYRMPNDFMPGSVPTYTFDYSGIDASGKQATHSLTLETFLETKKPRKINR